MAYQCEHASKECDGCGNCKMEKAVLYTTKGEPIYDGEAYYDIYGEIIHADDLMYWAKQFKKIAGD